jgi:aconitate hydratase
VTELAEGSTVTMRLTHEDGSTDEIPLTHTYNAGQIEWHRAGSALNRMAQAAK